MLLNTRCALPIMAALLCATLLPARAQDLLTPLKPGSVAPPFKTRTLDGKSLTLKSLRGQVVLMDVWATWCTTCRFVMPTLETLHQKYGDKGLKVIGLSMDDGDGLKRIKPFRKALKLTYTMAASPEANVKIATAYHAEILPSIYLIDQKGIVRWSQSGVTETEKEELTRRITELLAPQKTAPKMAATGKK